MFHTPAQHNVDHPAAQVAIAPVAPAAPFDAVGQIMAFENGELEDDDVVDLFQHLIDSGLVWQLQGSYGRMAQRLIDAGHCHA